MKKILVIFLIIILAMVAIIFFQMPSLDEKAQIFQKLLKEKQDNYIDISELIVPISYLQLAVQQKDAQKAGQILDDMIAQAKNIGEEKSLRGILPEPNNECTDPNYVNTNAFEAEPFITPNGKVLYFQYHPYVSGKCAGVSRPYYSCEDYEKTQSGPRTYRTELKNGLWTAPKMQIVDNCSFVEKACIIISVSADDKTAYVIAQRKSGQTDILISDRRVGDRGAYDLWQTPHEFSPNPNSDANDEDFRPDFLGNGGAFMSLSDKLPGTFAGTPDIYYLKSRETNEKGIVNIDEYLGASINTPAGEMLPYFDSSGNFYFTRAIGGKFLATSLMFSESIQCIKSNGRCLANFASPTVGDNKLVFRSPIPEGDLNGANSDIFYMEKISGAPNEWGTVKPWDNCGR